MTGNDPLEGKRDIKSMTLPELKVYMEELGEKSFRAKQLYTWLHKKLASSYDEMTDLPAGLRSRLASEAPLFGAEVVKRLVSAVDGTEKYLFSLRDQNAIESVLMRYKHGDTVCISSQVGCRMGCAFCASTLEGCVRDLTASEMLSQVYEIQKLSEQRVSGVVVMGSGEPLDNFDNLLRFIEQLSGSEGLNISQRGITVSTCGLVPKIKELADRKYAITLAISLHAPNDEKRRRLMPVAKAYPLDELMEACRYYFDKTGRRITFEYALIEGQNDSRRDAKELAALIKGMGAHINLIPVNAVKETGCRRPARQVCSSFKETLEELKVNATIRRELGPDINAACGQLRRGVMSSGNTQAVSG